MLTVGDVVPDFALPNQDGKLVHLSEFRGRRVVVFTFPRAGSLGCTWQACNLRDAFEDIMAENTVVLGISSDTQAELKDWKQKQRLPYDLLSDPEGQIVDLFEGLHAKLAGIKLPTRNRTLWVLDEAGRVFARHVPVMPQDSARLAKAALARMPAVHV